jgi:hypothetical protein
MLAGRAAQEAKKTTRPGRSFSKALCLEHVPERGGSASLAQFGGREKAVKTRAFIAEGMAN